MVQWAVAGLAWGRVCADFARVRLVLDVSYLYECEFLLCKTRENPLVTEGLATCLKVECCYRLQCSLLCSVLWWRGRDAFATAGGTPALRKLRYETK